jgi:MFS family permease
MVSNPDTSKREAEGEEVFDLSLTLRAFRHRNFKLFFGGQIVSLTGTWMQSVAQSWLVYRLTGSSLLLGSVGFAGQIPVFLLAFIGGAVADRYKRHRVVLAAQVLFMILAFILAALALLGVVQVWHVFVLAALVGVVNAFDIPARQSFFVELVGKEDLMNAIALNSSMFNSARILGPTVAGILVASIGEGWCFFANGASYLAVIIGLLMMRLHAHQPPVHSETAISQIVEAFHYVRRTKPIRALLLLLGFSSAMGMPHTVLMPIFADRILHGGAGGLGILMGASGIGALLGALVLAGRPSVRGLGRLTGYSCASFGICLVLFAISRVFWLSALLIAPVGFFMMLQLGCVNTLIQDMVPDRLRGRVMAFHSMMLIGMAPFGSFFAGLLAERLEAPLTVSLGAIGCLVVAVIFLLKLSSLGITGRSGKAGLTDISEETNLDEPLQKT